MATVEVRETKEKEGSNLLGAPTFEELENGRLRCVETGHELLSKDRESYSQRKRCRLGLIDYALSHKKPPLNLFKQDPLSRSKVICKLTGDAVNKSEEHIWKHINGKRFLNKLEQKEAEKANPKSKGSEISKDSPRKSSDSAVSGDKKKKKKDKKKKEVGEIITEVREASEKDSESEEPDFWMPPLGERWDFDDGGDRWGSGSENDESDEMDGAVEDKGQESEELSARTKRMSIEIGPSSFASRKKKPKKNT